MRVFVSGSLVALIIAMYLAPLRPVPAAGACSPAVPDLAAVASTADFIALVETIDVGASANPLPTIPVPSSTAAATSTAEPSSLATPGVSPTSAAASETRGPREPIDLRGIGARVRIIQSYAGQTAGEIDLDTTTRQRIAQAAREAEALPPGITTACPVTLGTAYFERGREYLVFATANGDVVTWATLIAREGAVRYLELEYVFTLPRTLADRYLPGVPVQDYSADGGTVLVINDHLPLETILAIARAARGEADIRPPNTGSASD